MRVLNHQFMSKMIRSIRDNEQGFDLMQILVVAIILSGLLAIAGLVLLLQANKGRDTAMLANIENSVKAAKVYLNEKGGDEFGTKGYDFIRSEIGNPDNIDMLAWGSQVVIYSTRMETEDGNTDPVAAVVVSDDGTVERHGLAAK